LSISTGAVVSECEIHECTPQEATEIYDRVARKWMGVSGAEFLQRWDAGEWDGVDLDDVPGLVELWVLMPFGRADE
jgi:hypothetical protein